MQARLLGARRRQDPAPGFPGQGFNLGLRDAWQLADILHAHARRRPRLDRYVRAHRLEPPRQRLLHRPDRQSLLQ